MRHFIILAPSVDWDVKWLSRQLKLTSSVISDVKHNIYIFTIFFKPPASKANTQHCSSEDKKYESVTALFRMTTILEGLIRVQLRVDSETGATVASHLRDHHFQARVFTIYHTVVPCMPYRDLTFLNPMYIINYSKYSAHEQPPF